MKIINCDEKRDKVLTLNNQYNFTDEFPPGS